MQQMKDGALPLPPYEPGTDPKTQAPATLLIGSEENVEGAGSAREVTATTFFP
jgi:hypothetical protein